MFSVFGSFQHGHDGAFGTRYGAFQEKKSVFVVHFDNFNFGYGMGGGAVSSVNTGQYTSGIELNAVQRANPEMQSFRY